MSYTRRAVLGLGVLFICQVLASAMAYGLRLVLARSLTPVEYGLLYAVLAFFSFFAFAQTLGLSDALVQRLPRYKTTAEVKSALLTIIYTQLAITGAIALIIVLLGPWLTASYFNNEMARPLIIICALYFVIAPVDLMLLSLFQGIGKMHWYSYLLVARTLMLVIATLVLLRLGFGILAPMLGYVLMYLVVPLIHLPLLLKAYPDFGSARAKYSLPLLREFFSFGIPVMLTGIIGYFLGAIDTFFLTLYRPLSDVALYNVAFPTASLTWFISGVIYTAMLPIASEMGAKNTAQLGDAIGRMYLYLFIAIVPFTAVILIFPDIIINALFGGQYVGAAVALQLLVVGGLFYVFSGLNASIITGMGKPRRVMVSMLVAALVNVIGDIILIPTYGVAGSAAATLIAFIVLFAMNLAALHSILSFSMPFKKMAGVLFATLLSVAALFWLRSTLALPLWWKIAIAIAGGSVVYAAVLFILRIVTVDELRSLAKMVQRR